jgi:type II secretory ATPase GspE/PulE/Tfp pilus assembly ATPase PilB-like protein
MAEADNNLSTTSLLNNYLLLAVRSRASDIHFEPDKNFLRVRLRIDGRLKEVGKEHPDMRNQVVARIKVLGEVDMGEKKQNIDGRFPIKLAGESLDIRFSIFPTIHGEAVVLRVLHTANIELGLEPLGMNANQLETYKKLIHKPYGLLLVTGPNGSGKTTTLYSSLNSINSIEKSIVTLEDPVEYHLPLLRQTQIDPDREITFSSGLKALLRQDPDVIMVGEIRDLDTAKIAVQASLTGHLVFSTLHTNNSIGALVRLLNMGVESFLVAYATLGVVAQRLVKQICSDCKEAYMPSAELLKTFNIDKPTEFYRGKGCQACDHTGYRGRTAIFELFVVTDEVRKLILKKASFDEIFLQARNQGMKTLREHGVEKITQGLTTPEEVILMTEIQ